jgi:signal transduction histidine kinase
MRYTPKGGLIKVVITPLEIMDQYIQVSVVDTGTGVNKDILPYIFDRFYRVDKSRTRSSGGSGLGLAIVKQLIEAHGGKVAAESPVFQNVGEQGYGTRITFSIPLNRKIS